MAFGKNTECSLPPREEAAHFIDKYGQCEEKTARFFSDFLGKIAKKQTKRLLMHIFPDTKQKRISHRLQCI